VRTRRVYRFDSFIGGFAENGGLPDPRGSDDYEFLLMLPVEERGRRADPWDTAEATRYRRSLRGNRVAKPVRRWSHPRS
jgi:hypothetical protein